MVAIKSMTNIGLLVGCNPPEQDVVLLQGITATTGVLTQGLRDELCIERSCSNLSLETCKGGEEYRRRSTSGGSGRRPHLPGDSDC